MTDLSARDERMFLIHGLVSDIGEIDSQIALLDAERQTKRAQLSELIAEAGGKVQLAGIARVELSAPAVTTSYDRKQLDSVVQELVTAGYDEIARRILACQKQSMRTGTLRITPERKA